MSKACIFCNDGELYPDTLAECPKCNNFLRNTDLKKAKPSDYDKVPTQMIHAEEDPYSGFYKLDGNKAQDKINGASSEGSDVAAPAYKTELKQQTANKEKPIEKPEKTASYQDSTGVRSDTKGELHSAEGIVKNVRQEEISSFFIERWFSSLFSGIPYVHNKTVNVFQLFKDQGFNTLDCDQCTQVVVNGQLSHGQLPENNRVKVLGKIDGSGALRAYKVYNLTSRTEIGINHGIPPALTWFITILFFLIISLLIYGASKVNWEQTITNVAIFVGVIIITLLWLKSKLTKKKK